MKTLFLAAAACAAAASPAMAAQYMFSFSTNEALIGGPVTGSGVFTTSDTAMIVGGRTAFAVTSITGTVNGSAIVAPTAASYGNYFTTGPTFLDGSGVRFNTVANTNIAFFNQSTNGRYRVNIISGGRSSYVDATSSPVTAAVPETATWAMMLGGFALVGGALRRRSAVARPNLRFA